MEKKKNHNNLIVGLSIGLGLFAPLVLVIPALAGLTACALLKKKSKNEEYIVEVENEPDNTAKP